MYKLFDRREFLKNSVIAGAAASSPFMCVEPAKAAPIDVPTIDRLSIRVILDGAANLFYRAAEVAGVRSERPPAAADYRRSLHNEWGLSLFLESRRAGEDRTVMLDFGYTPETLLNNIELLGVDPKKIDAMVVSHGHYDHFGGLIGFLDKFRASLPSDVKLYAGGEDNFCHRWQGAPGSFSDFGALDRRALVARQVSTVLAEQPVVIAGHAFTTGPVKRTSSEKVLPNTNVEYAMKDGLGCNAAHYTPAELQGKIVPDEHLHEHATCFNVRDKGLVVITSCGHAGIINTMRTAQEVSGVRKIHALVGGFHLGPAPEPYHNEVMAQLKEMNPDVVIPMHCSGQNFADAVTKFMPGKLLASTTGARLTFGA